MPTKPSQNPCEVCGREKVSYVVSFGIEKSTFIRNDVTGLIECKINPEWREFYICVTDLAFINKMRKKFPNATIPELLESAINYRKEHPIKKLNVT